MYAAVDSVNVSIGKHNTKLYNFEKFLSLVRLFSNSSSKEPLVCAHTLKNTHLVVASWLPVQHLETELGLNSGCTISDKLAYDFEQITLSL